MPTIQLTDARQDALRSLLALSPPAEGPAARTRALAAVRRLIPCDRVEACTVDRAGWVVDAVSVPAWPAILPAAPGPAPVLLGVHHVGAHPAHRRALARDGLADSLELSFREAGRQVVRLHLDRRRARFSAADAALLRTVAPALQALLRTEAGAWPGTELTAQETRVLQLVAAGLTNADVAARISVAPGTVRKHLEHAFRKLGVTNRLAAVRAVEASSRLRSSRP